MRWRPDSREESIRRVLSLVIALIANIAFLFASLFLMQVSGRQIPVVSSGGDRTLLVRLLEMPVVPAASVTKSISTPKQATLPVFATSTRYTRRRTESAVRHDAPEATRIANPDVPDSAVAPLQLFNADGSLPLVPGSTVRLPATDFPTQPRTASASSPFMHRDALPYRLTAFERVWALPRDETLIGELVRKTTVSHTWRTPWGTQIRCAGSILVPPSLLGCGWGLAPRATAEELQDMRADPPLPRAAGPATEGASAEK